MIKLTGLVSASAIALTAGSFGAQANTQQVIDAIIASLNAQGFARIEIVVQRNGFDVDAYGPGREGDFYFDSLGELTYSDIDTDDDEEWDGGTIPLEDVEIEYDDDGDDDEEDEADEDDVDDDDDEDDEDDVEDDYDDEDDEADDDDGEDDDDDEDD